MFKSYLRFHFLFSWSLSLFVESYLLGGERVFFLFFLFFLGLKRVFLFSFINSHLRSSLPQTSTKLKVKTYDEYFTEKRRRPLIGSTAQRLIGLTAEIALIGPNVSAGQNKAFSLVRYKHGNQLGLPKYKTQYPDDCWKSGNSTNFPSRTSEFSPMDICHPDIGVSFLVSRRRKHLGEKQMVSNIGNAHIMFFFLFHNKNLKCEKIK